MHAHTTPTLAVHHPLRLCRTSRSSQIDAFHQKLGATRSSLAIENTRRIWTSPVIVLRRELEQRHSLFFVVIGNFTTMLGLERNIAHFVSCSAAIRTHPSSWHACPALACPVCLSLRRMKHLNHTENHSRPSRDI